MSFLISAEVHDCMSDFSRSMTAALHANSIVASSPKRVFANGQTAVNQVVPRLRSVLVQDRAWCFALERLCKRRQNQQERCRAED